MKEMFGNNKYVDVLPSYSNANLSFLQYPSSSRRQPVSLFKSHEGLILGNFSPRISSNILRHLSSRINHFENKNLIFIKMENEGVLRFKLKLKGNLFTEGLLSKEDLIELIRQSEEWQVEPTHSTLLEKARRKKIRNHTILTKYELKKALGLASEDKPRSRSYIFSNSSEERGDVAALVRSQVIGSIPF